MRTVGLRELRQDASEIVRAVQNGEEIEITVAGRSAARLVAAKSQPWQTWDAIAHIWSGPADLEWERDCRRIDQTLSNPWRRKP
jgi:prevent-host-death family protein